ncbi:MAG: YdcF family protein [Gemmatimonadota bacterium]
MTRWALRLLGALTLAYLGVLAWAWWESRQDQRQAADVIVVLGAAQYNGHPSPVLRARLDHAIDLFRAHLGPRIIVTGGIGLGDAVSEASVSHRYLVAHGVPDSSVVDRPEGRDTEASMIAVSDWARLRGVDEVLLVSDGFHMARLKLEARAGNLVAYTSPTPTSPIVPGSGNEWRQLALEALKIPVAWIRTWARRPPPNTEALTPKP